MAVTAGVVVALLGAAAGIYAVARHRAPPKPALGTDTTADALALAAQAAGEDASSPVVAEPAPPGQSVPGYAVASGYPAGAAAMARGNAPAEYAPATVAPTPGAVYSPGYGSTGSAPIANAPPAPAPEPNGAFAPAPAVRAPSTARSRRSTAPVSRPGYGAARDTALPAGSQATPPEEAPSARPQPSPAPRPDARPRPDSQAAPAPRPADGAPKPAAPPAPKPDTARRPAPDTSGAERR